MIDSMQAIMALAATGILAGFLAGLFGIGGGVVIVPSLYFYLQSLGVSPSSAMTIAINTSLISIIPTAISSARAHHKLGQVDWSLVRIWAPALGVGVGCGSALVAQIRSPLFSISFAILLIGIAINKIALPLDRQIQRTLPTRIWQMVFAYWIGFISVCAGVGGGATGVPVMVAMGVPVHRAVGSCAALGLVVALPGALAIVLMSQELADAPAASWRFIYFPAIIGLLPATISFAPIGAKVGRRLSGKVLDRWFAILLLLVGGKMLLSVA